MNSRIPHILTLIVAVVFAAAFQSAYALQPRLQASVITCRPGPEVYELVGHEALRIRGIDENGAAIDTVWNYGVFDFASPNFVMRFVKGQTDYMLFPSPTQWFLSAYRERGSGVVEQDLNLTPEETSRLLRLLQINALPANRTYRYNYVRDNCSTRVADIIDSATTERKILYPDTTVYSSFRDAMRDFHRDYPWYQFGIDLVLGSGIDHPLTPRQEQFAPSRLEAQLAQAKFSDGTPAVKATRALYAGDPSGIPWPDGTFAKTLAPTPWWISPLAISLLLLALSIVAGVVQWRKARIYPLIYTAFFGLLGLAGCIVWFLVFFSSHDSTSPNLLALWLNPLQLVIAVFVWWRTTRPVAMAMATVDLVILVILIGAWPLQPQHTNPAVFPLWGVTLALAMSFVATYARRRSLINHSEPTARKASGSKSSRSSKNSRSPKSSRSPRNSRPS